MHLIVLGANGLLGSNVVHAAQQRNWTITGAFHSAEPDFDIPLERVDITDTERLQDILIDSNPDWVINCAAITDVDGCEERSEKARAVNARAPGDIAAICKEKNIKHLHVSTDYVFDGRESGRYSEDANVSPIQAYGKSKLEGEREVQNQDQDALVARLSFVWGVHRNRGELTGFPAWVRDRLAAGNETPLFTDQHVTPTRAGQAAETFLELIDRGASEMFHVASQSCITPYEFGNKIARQMGADETLLVRGSQDNVDRVAERPIHTCLDCTHLEETLGREQPTLDEDLAAAGGAFS